MVHGAKKGQQQAQKPHIAKDDLVSVENYKGLYGLAEGEIEGLADGGKSIKLDGTPLINDNGTPNFADVAWEFRAGTQDQSHIAGFVAVENETRVGVELRHDRPWVKAITNRELSAVRVRLNFNALREQDDNGNIKGYAISYAVDVQTDGGAFVEVLTDSVRGKASSGFKRSHRIDLPKLPSTGKSWTIRVRRLTPNRDSDLISDTMSVDAITEIIDAKLRYPNTAMLALTYNAKTFSNVAKVAVRLKGKIIQVPSNYNPQTRTYTGLWDGTFKLAYSNNPAWVFYDLCTHKRYGLGERLSGMVDKWRLYQIGQYCDEMVDDGKGGQEPRFTINVYIQKADDAYRVLQNIASTFRGMSFWDGSQIVLDSDTPKDPVYTFSPANVVGEFVYQGTRARDRHTFVRVAWDNPENNYQTEYEPVPDEENIAKYGMKQLDINAFGCTSRGQAQRVGLWALKAEQLETQTVSFKTGLMGFIPQVGQVINIADNVFAGRAVSGRILAVNGKQITLDRTAGKVGDTITLNTLGQIATTTITAVHGDTLTLDKTMGETGDVWAIISDDLKLMQFRVLTITQNDDATFDITALQYDRQKYAMVDNGAIVTPQPYTVLKATPITAPNSVTLTSSNRTVQGQNVATLTINWEQVQGATAYIVEWRKDDGNWQTLPKVSGQSVDIDGVYAGKYTARVRAVDSFDNESLATSSQLTAIAGKTGKPPRLTSLTVQGILFGMNLGWAFARGSDDTNFTEIQVSPDGRSNITTLGTFAYPTNKHEITGLQGGLTQFYRGRIVDKLGNTSDWTAWVRGVTENNAEKVLNLISGQITESHLNQSLATPIAKIGTLETAVNAVNAQLPTLNGQISAVQNELNTAKNTLQTAVGNITTERNRINNAVRDITALQTANNAKTQEIANLTNTVGGHTSSIRELGVTTGDLTQKYSQLKTATDTANSEIATIKQTQSGQATSIERLGAKFDDLAVGGENILRGTAKMQLGSGVWNTATFRKSGNGALETIVVSDSPIKDVATGLKLTPSKIDNFGLGFAQDQYALELGYYTLSFWINGVAGDTIKVQPFWANQNQSVPTTTITLKGGWEYVSFTGKNTVSSINQSIGYVYLMPVNLGDTAIIVAPMLEKATIASAWQPSRFDVQAELDGKASTANLETLRQTLTSADIALAQQITALDTAYKSANNDLTARLAREETARASSDNANAQALRTLESTVNGVSGRVGTSESKIASLERTTSDLNGAIATAQNQLNARFDNIGNRIIITTATDLNTLTTQGKYFIKAPHTNSPNPHWLFVDVENSGDGFVIKQTATQDNDIKNQWVRQRYNGEWRAWEKLATGTDISQANATIDSLRQTVANGDNALSQRIDNLTTDYNGNKANIASQLKTLSDKEQALSQRTDSLNASFNDISARTKTRVNLLPNGGFENGFVGWSSNTDFVLEEHPSFGRLAVIANVSNKTGAFSLWSDKMHCEAGRTYVISCDTASHAQTCRVYCDLLFFNAQNQVILDGNQAPFDNNHDYAVVPNRHEAQTQAPQGSVYMIARFVAENVTGGRHIGVRQIKVEVGNLPSTPYTADTLGKSLTASIDEVRQTVATQHQATASQLSTLQTTVNGQSASIQQHAQSLNGLSAQWTLKVQSGNIVSGIGLASNNGVSDFAVRADKFYIASPTGQKGDTPFTVLTSPQVINGVRVPAGTYIKDAYIANGSITNAKLANASIDNAKIANASIDSVKIRNGAVGSLQLQDGAVTSAKIGHLAVDTLNIADEAIIVPRALNAGFKEWNGEIENEVIFTATMNSQQAPIVINLFAQVSGATISDRYNAYSSPPRINLIATHIASGEKEWILGYDEKNPPPFSKFIKNGYLSADFDTGDNNHYFSGGGTAGYFGSTKEINRNTLLFLPKYSGEYRFELTLTLKGNVRARLYEASMLLMAVKR